MCDILIFLLSLFGHVFCGPGPGRAQHSLILSGGPWPEPAALTHFSSIHVKSNVAHELASERASEREGGREKRERERESCAICYRNDHKKATNTQIKSNFLLLC